MRTSLVGMRPFSFVPFTGVDSAAAGVIVGNLRNNSRSVNLINPSVYDFCIPRSSSRNSGKATAFSV